MAGGTNLIDPQQESRLATLKDALDYQPGLVVQEFFGGLDQPRLNIRGSGIQSNPVNRGVLLMQDGLPLNEADGSFVIGFLEPRNARLISVRRGANALSPAATTLGGELDLQSLTGTEGDLLRLESGSYGRVAVQAGKGFEADNMDGRLSVTHDRTDGYRDHSASDRTRVDGNFGLVNDRFENRTYLSFTDVGVDIPFVVTRAQMKDDPRETNGGSVPVMAPFNQLDVRKRDPYRDSQQWRLANRSHLGDETLGHTIGVYVQNIDDVFQDPMVNTSTDGITYGAQYQLEGRYNRTAYRFGIDVAASDMTRDFYTVDRNVGNRKLHFGDYDLTAENRSAVLGFTQDLAGHWQLTGDVKANQAIRNADDRLSANHLNQDWKYTTPRLGVQWHGENTRWFANVSRNYEAPTFWEIIATGPFPNPMNDAAGSTVLAKLDLQQAETLELGGSGSLVSGPRALLWDLALYQSNVTDELMSVSTLNGTPAGTYNYRGKTRHRGAELGLNGKLPLTDAGAGLAWRLAWTLSDFRFRGGEYAGNRIAGVPRNVLSTEVLWKQGGWSAGPNVRWIPTATETNHANRPDTRQNPYAILGFKVDYRTAGHWNFHVQGDNLGNRTYASAFVIRNNAPAGAPTFLPGNGRSATAGASYRF